MEDFILNSIHSIVNGNPVVTYIFFFLSGVLQLVFPPYPSDVIIIFEGYVTTVGAHFHFLPILLISVFGSLVGSVLVYWFGYKKGDEVLRYKIVLKYIDQKHIKRSEKVFHKYGRYGLILSKFIPGTSSIMVLFSGVFKVKKRIYFTYIILSIFLQQIIYLFIGRIIGNNIDGVKRFLSIFNLASLAALVCIIATGFIIYKVRKARKKPSDSV